MKSTFAAVFDSSRFLLLATVVCLLPACSSKQEQPKPSAQQVGVVTLKAESVALQTELAGRTTASLTSDVRPQVDGLIQARRFEEGAQVKAGQVLYQIDPAKYQAAYDEARAALVSSESAVDAAKLKDERYRGLAEIEGVSKQDADDARTSYRQSVASVAQQKASLTTARINLDYTQVRAPISGRIGTSSVTPGALVTAGQTDALATIRALDPIYVDLTQSSSELLQLRRMLASGGIKAGTAEVSLKLEDGSAYPIKGTLRFSEVAVDEATGSVTLRAEFPNPDGTLLPGMYVRAVLNQAVDPAAILAPQRGIGRDSKGNATAMVVNAEQKVEARAVTTRRAVGDQWLISSGLAAGDRLVVEGLSKIKAGDTVQASEAGAAQAPAAAPAPAAPKG